MRRPLEAGFLQVMLPYIIQVRHQLIDAVDACMDIAVDELNLPISVSLDAGDLGRLRMEGHNYRHTMLEACDDGKSRVSIHLMIMKRSAKTDPTETSRLAG